MAHAGSATHAGGGGHRDEWWASVPGSVCWQPPCPVPTHRCIPWSRRCSSRRALSTAPGLAAKQNAVALGKLRHRASWWTRPAAPGPGSTLWVLYFHCRGQFCPCTSPGAERQQDASVPVHHPCAAAISTRGRMRPAAVHPQGLAEAKLTLAMEWKYKTRRVEPGPGVAVLVRGGLARGVLPAKVGKGSTACQRHSTVPRSPAPVPAPQARAGESEKSLTSQT
uniref:Uncharacterized protein n=1 Tax=Aquila chrysaetos chrysaetos TaxID=223781 RepID=A0A663EZY6_AQUCH